MENTNEQTRHPHIPTMKWWGIVSVGLSVVMTVAVLIGVFYTDKDMSNLATVAGLAYAELATYTGAYSFKERAENKKKIACGLVTELAGKYGIEAIAPIIQSVIQD